MSCGLPVFVTRIGASRGQLRGDEEAFWVAVIYGVAELADEGSHRFLGPSLSLVQVGGRSGRSALLAGEVEAFEVNGVADAGYKTGVG